MMTVGEFMKTKQLDQDLYLHTWGDWRKVEWIYEADGLWAVDTLGNHWAVHSGLELRTLEEIS